MKTIKLNGKTYRCPESWAEVTLKQQIQVSVDSDAITLDALKKYSVLSGYANIPIDELKHSKIQDLIKLFEALKFINTPLSETPQIEFHWKGDDYYAGQNIVEMEFQDFISIENTIQEASGNTYNALPTILAVMCKRKKDNGVLESIDDYDVMERSKLFLDLPISVAHGLSLFFSVSEKLYSNLTQLYSNPVKQKELAVKEIDTVESMLKELDGRGWLTRWLTGLLGYCNRHTRQLLDKHFTSTQ